MCDKRCIDRWLVSRRRRQTAIGPTANGKVDKPLMMTSGREAAFRPVVMTTVIPLLGRFLTALRLIIKAHELQIRASAALVVVSPI
jgi:hypothetical protein